ncbi:MAG: hypothetical protein H6739_23270 [Alphaproteobacteria bacterium]|nr:hypothetical protein [Alphaproteobacteria bacterium]
MPPKSCTQNKHSGCKPDADGGSASATAPSDAELTDVEKIELWNDVATQSAKKDSFLDTIGVEDAPGKEFCDDWKKSQPPTIKPQNPWNGDGPCSDPFFKKRIPIGKSPFGVTGGGGVGKPNVGIDFKIKF